jgi:hypothetical protein
VAAGLALLAAAGAFLIWGPIGFGDGPLSLDSGAEEGNLVSGRGLLAIFIPVRNTGHDAAAVDSVRLTGVAGYPVPQVITLHLTGAGPTGVGLCGGTWPVRATRPRLTIAGGCPARDIGPLPGHPIGYSAIRSQLSAVAVVRPPGPGRCWAVTAVTVRYHVGIRHWTATYPGEFTACASTSRALLNRAMNRVAQAGPQ